MIRLSDIHIEIDDDTMICTVGVHNPKAPKGQLSVHTLPIVEGRVLQAIISEIEMLKEAKHEREIKAPRKTKSGV